MKIRPVLLALAAACLSSSALAHPYDEHPPQFPHERYERYERHHAVQRCDYRRPWVHERDHRPHHRTGGAGPCHDIYRGERLPEHYWSARYHVRNWWHHDLPRPWQGHHWIRVENDFVMVSRSTGRVGKVILLRHRR